MIRAATVTERLPGIARNLAEMKPFDTVTETPNSPVEFQAKPVRIRLTLPVDIGQRDAAYLPHASGEYIALIHLAAESLWNHELL